MRDSKAFTLLEIILVLSLIALIAGLAMNNIDGLLKAAAFTPPEQRFRDIVSEARIVAAENRETVTLSYNAEQGHFVLSSSGSLSEEGEEDPFEEDDPEAGEEDGSLFGEVGPSQEEYSYSKLTVTFFPMLSNEENDDPDERNFAEEPIDEILFYPTGLSTPVKAVFEYDGRDITELTLDAFSPGPLPVRNERLY